jgi:hypothetical protein
MNRLPRSVCGYFHTMPAAASVATVLKASAAFGVCALLITGCATPPASNTARENSITLIKGETGLNNWVPIGFANWQAHDGVIEANGMTRKTGGYLVSRDHYANYRLHVEFWVSPDAKSGVFLRCTYPDTFSSKNCYEVQIYDQRPEPVFKTGSIVNVADTATPQLTGGKWNTYDITADGSHLSVVLNGTPTASATSDVLHDGHVVLQYRGGTVRFRNVSVTPLP